MRTVYAKILLWCFGTVVFCLIAFATVSWYTSRANRGAPFMAIDSLRLDEAVRAYQAGGAPALAANLRKMQQYFHTEAHLTDARGNDLLTGVNRSLQIAQPPGPHRLNGQLVVAVSRPGSQYHLVVLPPPPSFDPATFLPYYVLIFLAMAGLCWALAAKLASPLRQLALTLERFGAGDLDARSNLTRRDEIGDLARAFNQMADRLQTLLIAERRLLQDISHELRSPLARLSFAAELTKTATDREAAAARLRKDIDRLANLVGGLLQVTRAEGDFAERNIAPVSVDLLLQDIVESCQLEADARPCRIELAAMPDTTLRGDAEVLRRAFENVLRNAIRYAPPQSDVEVKLERRGSLAEISIRDFGPGVPEELLPRLFTPFFRADPSRDSATGGVGLGLAIAHRAVSLHHGQISVQNAGPGLRVMMSLPISSNGKG